MDLLNLTLPEIIIQKVTHFESEINTLKHQYKLLTGNDYDFSLLKNSDAEQLRLENEISLPSIKEMRDKIESYSEIKIGTWFKTSELIKYYYSEHLNKKDFKEDITRRFSGVLGTLVTEGELKRKKEVGERGDFYMKETIL
ncbi:MAG TPA: hypothetical protein PLP23_09240 [Panacibacter sp.]|nr:hypothetical protein [Panacibacter sp.]